MCGTGSRAGSTSTPEDNPAAAYSLEHLDARSNVSQRENAKSRLAAATEANPHGILNVGIFGEGTDSPSLSAVAFLEARKSPIDVIQAVGRAMRTAPDKSLGYIICPFPYTSQRRRRNLAQQQFAGGRMAGVGADPPGIARP